MLIRWCIASRALAYSPSIDVSFGNNPFLSLHLFRLIKEVAFLSVGSIQLILHLKEIKINRAGVRWMPINHSRPWGAFELEGIDKLNRQNPYVVLGAYHQNIPHQSCVTFNLMARNADVRKLSPWLKRMPLYYKINPWCILNRTSLNHSHAKQNVSLVQGRHSQKSHWGVKTYGKLTLKAFFH